MSRVLVVLVMVVAIAGGLAPYAYRERPPRFAQDVSEIAKHPPARGASRDRSVPGKARRRARRAVA